MIIMTIRKYAPVSVLLLAGVAVRGQGLVISSSGQNGTLICTNASARRDFLLAGEL